ncbi:MAG: hypothetical protein KAH03_04835 [Cocleimonas sp.]|nr:hypothetical protein [Cocleimonas sp.]
MNCWVALFRKAKQANPTYRVCGGELSGRADDQDEGAINKRHDIYYDETTGTMAVVNYFKNTDSAVIAVDGSKAIKEISEEIMAQIS